MPIGLLLFITIPFLFYPFQNPRINNSGPWTVALLKVNNSANLISDIQLKIKNRQFITIKNDNKDFPDNVEFNADPFLFEYHDSLFLFTETKLFNQKAHISVYLVDKSNLHVDYLGVAIKESFHLSYPAVYHIGDKVYLIPETQQSGVSLVYQAIEFPYHWEVCDSIFRFPVKDPTLVFTKRDIGKIYYSQKAMLYRSDFSLTNGKFTVGESEYIRSGMVSRPGGNAWYDENDTMIFLQNSSNGYGTGLDIFNEKKLSINEFLRAIKGFKPFNAGMHHFSSCKSDKEVFIAVDGNTLISDKGIYNFKNAFKMYYLTIWGFWFSRIEPFYPFNY